MLTEEETYDFSGTVVAESGKAILVQIGDKEVWLPRNLCEFSSSHMFPGDFVEVTVPSWLAEKNEIEQEAE